VATQDILHAAPAKGSILYDPRVRSVAFQVVLLALLALGVWWIVDNTIENLRRSNISTGFAFLRGRAKKKR
jgi:general L-amino acid transport system permease protein